MWQHNYEPVGGSLAMSALVAAIPIFVLFSMLGILRKPTWMAASSALASALIVALAAYGMPVKLAVMATIFGAAFGIFPITWICFGSILLYRLAVDTGKFEVIKDSVGGLTNLVIDGMNGLLVRPLLTDLADGVRRVIEGGRDVKKLKECGYQTFRRSFTRAAWALRWRAVIENYSQCGEASCAVTRSPREGA